MDKKLYLTENIFLMKLGDDVYFVSNVEDFSEPIYRDDIPFLVVGFGISKEVLEDFFDN